MCRVGLVGWDPETWFSATDVDVLFSRTENMISEENIFLHLMQVNRPQLRPVLMFQKSLFRLLSIFSSKMSSYYYFIYIYIYIYIYIHTHTLFIYKCHHITCDPLSLYTSQL